MCLNQKKKVLKEIELILSKTALINTCIIYYKQLIDAKRNQPNKYSIGGNFFNSVSSAYDYVIACEIWKIYNKKEQKGSIHSILDFCENNKSLFKSEDECTAYVSELRKKIEAKDLKTLKIYRSKYLAHSDKKFFGQEGKLLKSISFDLDYFNELNKDAIDILSETYGKIENCNYRYNPNLMTGFDLNSIIKNLK